MRTTSLLAIALSLVCSTPAFAQGGRGGGPAAPTQTIDARTAGFQKIDGYLPLYWDERTGSLWMEINKFDTEMLYSTGLTAGLGSQRHRARSRAVGPGARRQVPADRPARA